MTSSVVQYVDYLITKRRCFMKTANGRMVKLVLCMAFLVVVIGAAPSFAQQYPNKPINFLVTVPTGGSADTSARILADSASKQLGQPVVVSNNGAGSGSIALTALAQEKPDGYHIAWCSNQPLTLVPHLRQVSYKLNDFVPVMQVSNQPAGLVINADSPWKTLKELVDYAKKNPKKVSYTITGTYMNTHLAMMYIARQEGIEWTAIPVTTDPMIPVLGGHVTGFTGSSSWANNVRAGKLRLLAVYTEKRMQSFPDVPTLRELGYDFVTGFGSYIVAPKGTPSVVLKTLENAFRKAMETPEFMQYSQKIEYDLTYLCSSEDARKNLEAEYTRFSELYTQFKVPKESENK